MEAAAEALAAYGEKFMAMFDDSDDGRPRQPAEPQNSLSGACSSSSEDEKSETEELGFQSVQNIRAKSSKREEDEQERKRLRAERKTFLSGKIGGPTPPPLPKWRKYDALPEDDESRDLFRTMRHDVLNYGATGLDRKARKKFDAATRTRPEKGPRIPANIGIGMARKQQDPRAEQEAIEAGMLDIHKLARKRRREAEAARPRDGGLREDNGAFRNGVLRLRLGRPARGKKR